MAGYYGYKKEDEKKGHRTGNYWQNTDKSEEDKQENDGEGENQEEERQKDTLSPLGYFIMKNFFGF